jgi:hypothetical protein
MIPFGKQQEILGDFSTLVHRTCQETAGRLFIEGGVVVISESRHRGRNPKHRLGRITRYWGVFQD